jgi:hypothetical protein
MITLIFTEDSICELRVGNLQECANHVSTQSNQIYRLTIKSLNNPYETEDFLKHIYKGFPKHIVI